MAKEKISDNRTNGVTEADQLAKQAIGQMLEDLGLDHRNGTKPSDISVMAFRKAGLLGTLNTRFEGDIARSLRFARPDLFGQPLLNLGSVRPNDPVWDEWRQREEEIDSQITSTMVRKGKVGFYTYQNQMISDAEAKDLMRYVQSKKRVKRVNLVGQYSERIDSEKWWGQENNELRSIVDHLVKPGDTVLSFLTGHDAAIPSLLANKSGEKGQVYVVTPGPYLRNGLAEAFFNTFVNFAFLKGEQDVKSTKAERVAAKTERILTGSSFIDGKFRNKVSRFLHGILATSSETFYLSGMDWKGIGVVDKLLDDLSIFPLRYHPPELPSEIPSRSVDVVLEADRLSLIPEEEKEAVLYELDRVLKPRGLLLIREEATQQVLAQYYGQELFRDKYEQWRTPKGIRHWARWMVLHKLAEKKSTIISTTQTNNSPVTLKTMKDLASEINLARQAHVDENEPTLSVSWFKSKGLLPVLISEFQGNIGDAVAYAQKEDAAYRDIPEPSKEVSTQVKTSPLPPKDAKNSYTIEDLAKELNISKAQARRGVKSMGIKTLGLPTGTPGRSGFTRAAVESRKLHMSYEEYVIVRDTLKSRDLKPKNSSKEKGGNNNGS